VPDLGRLVLEGLKKANARIVVGLPDSLLRDVHDRAASDPDFRYIGVTNEGEGASVVAGCWTGGRRAVLVMENSGIRVACEHLSRLAFNNEIPVPMLLSLRGDLGTRAFRAHGHSMSMEPLLQAMRIPYKMITREEEVVDSVAGVIYHAISSQNHAALVFAPPLVGRA
jgi:sulfopyruvate decarboxylase subunit alpha